ncbi:Reticulon-like protein [Modicella reniformis]|uniref:Reticulon-like protein n=1 Tax=Modicella reniformis TaxID=1440133 RepID=A0A9P6J5L2_9FUNG|nr:Reticulon-like protein [Modicella reniformis]
MEVHTEDSAPAPRERSSDSPKAATSHVDHSSYMSPRLRSILLWERPAISAAHLGVSLTIVLLCRWVSLLNLVSGLFVVGTLASFVYVNGILMINRATNKGTGRPLEKYYLNRSGFVNIESETLHRRVDYVTDGMNVVLTELAKIVLIEDNHKSLKYIGISYTIWTLRTWFSTTTLLSMVLVSLFAAPRLYLDHQELIDTQVVKGRQIAQDQWTAAYSKAELFAQDKGILKKPVKTE